MIEIKDKELEYYRDKSFLYEREEVDPDQPVIRKPVEDVREELRPYFGGIKNKSIYNFTEEMKRLNKSFDF